jgi:hypothetical protein
MDESHMRSSGAIDRRGLLATGFFAAGAGLWPEVLLQGLARADEKGLSAEAAAIGRRELVKGLDGMSRVAENGNDPFSGGHNAAAVMASAFFCREQKLDEGTQKAMLAVIENRLLTSPIYEPRPNETSDPALIGGLLGDLDAGIDRLRRSGHNIIFANISLKALREAPEAATPARIAGLRKMVQSFGTGRGARSRFQNDGTFVDLGDETKFVHFAFEEFLKAIELYLHGKGHHGFAGHVLTIAHALLELRRAGYPETANKGVEAFWMFVRSARAGAHLGGQKVSHAPPRAPTPRDRAYWLDQAKHDSGEIVSSHLVKYPYSFYALARDVRDEDLKQRIIAKLYHLTAIS